METRGGGGCCIAMYGGGGSGGGGEAADAAWKMGRIMLRFRPIAPKPAAPATVGTADPSGLGKARGRVSRRSKRKSGGSSGGSKRRKMRKIETSAVVASPRERAEEKKSSSSRSSSSSTAASLSWSSATTASSTVVTLPLMPETPEGREEKAAVPEVPQSPSGGEAPYASSPWFRLRSSVASEVMVPRPVRPAGSWVTVKCVTGSWWDGEVGTAPASDEAVRRALETDSSCPGFITDEWHRVEWTNEAYRRMVLGPPLDAAVQPEEEEEEEEEEVRVGLLTRGMVPAAAAGGCRAFTCRVRVSYASRRRGKGTLAAPCDVWRLEDGRCAWRLDIKAALSLGI